MDAKIDIYYFLFISETSNFKGKCKTHFQMHKKRGKHL